MQMITKMFSFAVLVVLGVFVGGLVGESEAAYITAIEFRGGGCEMQMQEGICISGGATYDNTDYTVTVNRDFTKVEKEDSEDGTPSGNGACNQGGKGSCQGSGGKPDNVGHDDSSDDTHEHEELFDRLPPIHMFITLKNDNTSGVIGDTRAYHTYTFKESIKNGTDAAWDGLFYALKQNEDNRALFNDDEELQPENTFNGTTLFSLFDMQGKKLTFFEGSFNFGLTGGDGELTPLELTFAINFYDVYDPLLLKEDGTFSVMLQCFPLIEKPAPVPEPATMLLLGAGLTALAGRARTKRS